MKTVIGVKFKDGGKMYYFDPGEFDVKEGDGVIVETARGTEFRRRNWRMIRSSLRSKASCAWQRRMTGNSGTRTVPVKAKPMPSAWKKSRRISLI